MSQVDFNRVMRRLEQAKQRRDMQWIKNVASDPFRALREYNLSPMEISELQRQAQTTNIADGPPSRPPTRYPPDDE